MLLAWVGVIILYSGALMRLPFVLCLTTLLAIASLEPAHACGTKRYCTDMRNCAEATYYHRECRLTRLDRDKDGIPCETKCGKTKRVHERRLAAETNGKALAVIFGSASTALSLTDTSPDTTEYSCSTPKRFCKEMDTCAEATFYLKKCRVSGLDGNRDGIACNSLCR